MFLMFQLIEFWDFLAESQTEMNLCDIPVPFLK